MFSFGPPSHFAVVVKQLPHWIIGVLLQELSQFFQSEFLHPVLLCVPGSGSSALYGRVIVVHAAVGVPHKVWDVDPLHVVFDDPVVCRGNGSNQHEGLGALGQEEICEL